MKKQRFRFLAIFLVLVMIVGTLTACGKNEEEESSGRRRRLEDTEETTPTEEATAKPTEEVTATPVDEITAAPTEEITQTPTEAPTETPTEAPTAEPTAEPTVEPTEEPTEVPTEGATPVLWEADMDFSKLQELKSENGAFSILVPEGVETSVGVDRVYAWNSDWSIEVIYLSGVMDGAVYDAEDLKGLLNTTEGAATDLLYVAEYIPYGEPELDTINDVKCLVGPESDVVIHDSDELKYSRYIAYDCKYDTGIILANMMFYNYACDKLDDSALALEKEVMGCLESVEQYSAPSDYPGEVYTVTLPDGSEFEFISVEDAVNRVENDENTNGVDVYFFEGTAESIYIGKYKKTDNYSSPEEYFEFKKKENSQEMFHFSDPVDVYGRVPYSYWELTYHLAGDDYIEKVYVAENGDYLYIVFLYRYDYPAFEEDGEYLLSDIIWSLREK